MSSSICTERRQFSRSKAFRLPGAETLLRMNFMTASVFVKSTSFSSASVARSKSSTMNGRTVLSGIGRSSYRVRWIRSRATCLGKYCTSVARKDESSILSLLYGFPFRQSGGYTRPRLSYLVLLSRDIFWHNPLVMFMSPNDQINRVIEQSFGHRIIRAMFNSVNSYRFENCTGYQRIRPRHTHRF